MEITAKIISIVPITHNVKQFRIEKPKGYNYVPGQATELSINKDGWRDRKNPFTFTSLTDNPYLEFTIKIYADHHAVTEQLGRLNAGDELILRDSWGAIEYKGPGYFIAGGAGITPFIAIFRDLKRKNKIAGNTLFYANQTDRDVILKDELISMLGDRAHFTISKQKDSDYDTRRIDEQFLRSNINDFSRHFYICGPDEMVAQISETLGKLGAKTDEVVFEN